jgi:hypothetical protein
MLYAAAIWVEGSFLLEIDVLRRLWDAQHDAVAAHITIVYPQTPVGTEEEILDCAARAARAMRPFRVRLDQWTDLDGLRRLHPLGTRYLTDAFPGFPSAIVLLPSTGASEVLALRRNLDDAFGQPREVLDHPPFLTIGQGLDDRQAAAAATALARYRPDLKAEVSTFDVLKYDEGGAHHSLRTLALGG